MPSLRFLALSAAILLSAPPAFAQTVLHILHVNDFHSRIQSVNAFDTTCSEEDEAAGACFGGVARLYTAVEETRKALEETGEPVLVLDAGDQFQGSLFFSTYSGQAEAEFMNAIGFDAMVLGNHEFDLGPRLLGDFVAALDFPVVFGNVTTDEGRLANFMRDPVVIETAGVKVGLIGVTTPETAEISSPGPTIAFGDVLRYARNAVADLESQGVDKIIALTHQGVAADIRLAESVAGIDAIVGGHSHTLFSNTIEGAPFAYPHFVTDPEGRQVPVVSAGSYSKYLGHLTLTFNERGEVVDAAGDTQLLDASVKPDEAIAERVREFDAPLDELKKQVVAELSQPVEGSRDVCRVQECAMGNLVADAMLDRVRDQGVDVAIQNGGGLRASLPAGRITKGDVLAVLPFQNTLATFNLTGAGIVAALENGVSQAEEGGGRFPQVAGLRFTWDPAVAPGQGRVREVMVRQGDAWVPIDPEQTYAVASNNFLRRGGDGYAVFRDEGRNAYDFGPNLEEVLAQFLADNPGYAPGPQGRITRLD